MVWLGFSGAILSSLVTLVLATLLWFVLFKGVIYLAVLMCLTLRTTVVIDPYQFLPHYQARKMIDAYYLLFGTVTNLLASIAALFIVSWVFQRPLSYWDFGIQLLVALCIQYVIFENSRQSETEIFEIPY